MEWTFEESNSQRHFVGPCESLGDSGDQYRQGFLLALAPLRCVDLSRMLRKASIGTDVFHSGLPQRSVHASGLWPWYLA